MMRNDIKILRKLILDIAHYGQDANLPEHFFICRNIVDTVL